VNSLTSQIDGEIELNTNQGTTFTIIFEEKEE
jgi:two-component sensor histidine kinase